MNTTAPTATKPAICWPALLVCVLFGIVVGGLPHFLQWQATGDSAWVASTDELGCYLPFAANAFHNHPWRLADPALPDGGYTMYPWLQLIPGVLAAKLLGGHAQDVPLLWRLWSGFSLALGLYLLLNHFFKRPWMASLVAMMLLVDTGFMWARPFVMQGPMLANLLRDQFPEWCFSGSPSLLLHWRLTSPGGTAFFLLLHLFLLARAREHPERILLSGISFGALFYVYFYFWTAAALGLALAFVVDAGKRRVYLHTAWIGLLCGLPALAANALMSHRTNHDWPGRTNLFISVPHLSDLFLPLGAIVWAVGGLVWVRCWRRELMPVWAVGTASFLLMNQTLITGWVMCNGHWNYGRGIVFSLLLVLIVGGELLRAARWHKGLTALLLIGCAAHLGIGLRLRVLEAQRSAQPVELQANYAKYRAQRLATSAPALNANAVMAGDPAFVNVAVVAENVRALSGSSFLSPSLDNAQWDERETLQGIALGQDRAQFEAAQKRYFDTTNLGPWAFHPELRPGRIAGRLRMYDEFTADLDKAWDRHGVKYVALPSAQAAPGFTATGWRKLSDGPHWQIWERVKR